MTDPTKRSSKPIAAATLPPPSRCHEVAAFGCEGGKGRLSSRGGATRLQLRQPLAVAALPYEVSTH
jgi:hypothetical protein